MRRAGFTLVELLLAITLLTLLTSAAIAWAVAERRTSAAIAARYERLQQVLACARAIAEDLSLGAGGGQGVRPADEGALRVETLRRMPGEEPGRRMVRWEFDAQARALVRSSSGRGGERRQVAMDGLEGAVFRLDDDRSLHLVVTGPNAFVLDLPLWTER